MKITLIIVILLSFVQTSFALDSDSLEKPFIDKGFETFELEMAKIKADCREKAKNVKERLECGNEIYEKYKAEGKLRGTDEYCHANYRQLSYKALEQFRSKLSDQKKKARFDTGIGKRQPGEITKSLFAVEMGWIDSRLLEMREEITKKKHQEVWNKGKKAQ